MPNAGTFCRKCRAFTFALLSRPCIEIRRSLLSLQTCKFPVEIGACNLIILIVTPTVMPRNSMFGNLCNIFGRVHRIYGGPRAFNSIIISVAHNIIRGNSVLQNFCNTSMLTDSSGTISITSIVILATIIREHFILDASSNIFFQR